MEKHYELFIGIDVSKGKADATILKVSNLRSIEPVLLRKNYPLNLLNPKCYHFFLLSEANMMITAPV